MYPVSLALEGGFFTTEPCGKSQPRTLNPVKLSFKHQHIINTVFRKKQKVKALISKNFDNKRCIKEGSPGRVTII